MAKIFEVEVTTGGTRKVKVVAETSEEALAKVVLNEGETVTTVTEGDEVIL